MTRERDDDLEQVAQERLVTIKEAALMLGISVRAFYRLMAAGELPSALKVGRASRIAVSEINAYIDRLKEKRDAVDRRSRGRDWKPPSN